MKCLTKGCKNNSLLMTVELCYPCSQLVEKGTQNDIVTDLNIIAPYIDRIAELELKIVMLDEACANCGVKTTDGYALYCVKCSEAISEQEPLNLLKQSEREGWRYANELVLEIKRLQELTVNREWVGLTDEDISKAKTLLKDNDPEYAIFFIMNRLQEYNTCR